MWRRARQNPRPDLPPKTSEVLETSEVFHPTRSMGKNRRIAQPHANKGKSAHDENDPCSTKAPYLI